MERPGLVEQACPPVDAECRKRTILVEKHSGSFGFSIQSYGIQYRRDSDVDIITYIDQVDSDGPAEKAGMREGDVIMSINGQDMENCDHDALVRSVRQCPDRLRMDVVFEDCVRKVRLHMRYIQLQRQLTDRMYALEQLCEQEKHFVTGLRARGRPVQRVVSSRGAGGARHPSVDASTRRSTSSVSTAARRALPSRRAAHVPTGDGMMTAWRPLHGGVSWDHICCRLVYCCEQPPSRAAAVCAGFPVLCRARARVARSAESLLGPGRSQFDTSCFSCECLGALMMPGPTVAVSPLPRLRRAFFKPKSADNLLAAAARGYDAVRRVDKMKQKQQHHRHPSTVLLCRNGSRTTVKASGGPAEHMGRA